MYKTILNINNIMDIINFTKVIVIYYDNYNVDIVYIYNIIIISSNNIINILIYSTFNVYRIYLT